MLKLILPSFGAIRFYARGSSGINRRAALLREGNPSLGDDKITEEMLDELEFEVNEMPEKVNEMIEKEKKINNMIQFKKVERKYFGIKKLPNMLLWSEKESIRQLHNTEPQTWTIQKLSESFPATPDIIIKIIKSQWKFKNNSQIKKHDESVVKNWRSFEAGKLDLVEKVTLHLKKFTSRRQTIPEKDKLTSLPEITNTEQPPVVRRSKYSNTDETYVIGGKRYGDEHITLEKLKEETILIPTNTTKSSLDKVFSEGISEPKQSAIPINTPERPPNYKTIEYSKSGNSTYKEYIDDIPDFIKIPVDKRKKGSLYKYKNAYYSDDGSFLYKLAK